MICDSVCVIKVYRSESEVQIDFKGKGFNKMSTLAVRQVDPSIAQIILSEKIRMNTDEPPIS